MENTKKRKCVPLIEKKLKADDVKKDLPKTICKKDGKPIELKYGRFGLYLSFNNENYRIPKGTDASSLTEQDALDIVEGKKKSSTTQKPLKTFASGAEVLVGRYGEYIKYNGKNFRIPKGENSSSLTEEKVNKIIEK